MRYHVSAAVLSCSLVVAIEAGAQGQPPPPPLPPPAASTAPAPAAPAPSTTATARPPSAQPPVTQPPAAQPQPPAAQQPATPYPPGYGQQAYPPGYGQQVPPGYGAQGYPPGYGAQSYPPGYGPPVYGQPAYGPAYPGYGAYAGPVAPPAPAPEGVHQHDGFYLRMAFGIGHLSSSFSMGDSSDDFEMSGTGMGIDFAMGGAIVPGFILAGRIQGINAYNPSYKTGAQSTTNNTELMLSTIQVAADIYPMPKKGLHFMAGVGPATLSFKQKYNTASGISYEFDDSTSLDGIAFSAGAGWETWVGQQWGIGGMVGFTWAWFKDDLSGSSSNEAETKVFAPSVMFTATYN